MAEQLRKIEALAKDKKPKVSKQGQKFDSANHEKQRQAGKKPDQ